jgi:hypothetical protein
MGAQVILRASLNFVFQDSRQSTRDALPQRIQNHHQSQHNSRHPHLKPKAASHTAGGAEWVG